MYFIFCAMNFSYFFSGFRELFILQILSFDILNKLKILNPVCCYFAFFVSKFL